MRTLLLSLCGILLVPALALAQGPRAAPPDLVLTGGKVFTADPGRPWVEAIAIRAERIVAVGSTAEIERLAGPDTRRIPLGGRTLVPGFNDAHAHLGASLPGIVFRTGDEPVPDPPLALVLDSLSALVRRVPAGTWLRTGIDATLLDDRRGRRAVLDSVAPAHPVWLGASTGHGAIVNTAALRALGIPDDAKDPAGGFYEREGDHLGAEHGRRLRSRDYTEGTSRSSSAGPRADRAHAGHRRLRAPGRGVGRGDRR